MSNKVVRLQRPPQPTLFDPYAQVKWMFFQVEREYREPRAAGFRSARNRYIEFLATTGAYYAELADNPRFFLEKYWEADALIRFNRWLLQQDLRSKSRYGLYKTVRQVMDMAYALRVIDTIVYHAPMFKGVSETKVRAAYGKREQEVINAAVARWICLANSLLQGYTPSGSGVPYRRKSNHLSITFDGQTYSFAGAARAFGVEQAAISKRLRQGWTPRQAVGLDPSPKAHSLRWIVNGKEYSSAVAVSQHFGVSAAMVRYWKKRGWTPEQIVGIEPKPKSISSGKAIQTIIDNRVFTSLKQAARHYGVSYGLVKHRRDTGWTLREALGLDERTCVGGTPLTVEGVHFDSITQAAAAYGHTHSTVSLRLRQGLTPEQAVGVQPISVSKDDDRALLWRFENEFGCDARAMLEEVRRRRGSFSGTCSETRLLRLFIRWGVWPYVDHRLLMPLAVELGMLTGLNVESLKMLEIDSYAPEHRLTGQPFIAYKKLRSASATRSEERELHVPTLELEELYLDQTAGEKVHRLIGLILAITAKIRGTAPSEIATRLFIFEDVEGSRSSGQPVIVPFDPHRKVATWYSRFVREEGLCNVLGPDFTFNISRCRPTLATNMVLHGADLFQVQAVLGHESIGTTAMYLDEQNLAPTFNRTVSQALDRISRRSSELQAATKAGNTTHTGKPLLSAEGFCETLSGCGCINPYEPSPLVQEATNFKSGSICKYWNMCLLCDGAVITENSLPKLLLYRNRVESALAVDSPAIRARKALYQDVLKLIDGIVQVDLIFPLEVIERARSLAATMDDILVDQLIYQGL